jgi:hypothetical protein
MNQLDEWGRDPSVRAMRGVFGLMESFQDGFLHQLRIDRYDPRLRAWRNKAKRDFEKSWAETAGGGIQLRQEQLATIYLRCLADVMRSDGILIPNDLFEGDMSPGATRHAEADR